MTPWWARLRCMLFGHPTPALGVVIAKGTHAAFHCKRCGDHWFIALDG